MKSGNLLEGAWRRRGTWVIKRVLKEFLAYQRTLNSPAETDNKEMIFRIHLLPAFGKRGSTRTTSAALTPTSWRSSPSHTSLREIAMLEEPKPKFDFLDFEETAALIAAD